MRPRGHPPPLGLVACVATLAACAANPVTGRPELVLVSSAREQELGRQAAERVESQVGLLRDAELVGYVAEVGRRVASHSPRRDVTYSFQLVDLPEPNAFALPDGHIYVSRGLLALLNDEAELANVLGHELAHVAGRHSAQRQTRGVGLGLVLLPATVAGAALGVAIGAPGDLLGAAVNAPLRLLGGGMLAAYGRTQEREADRVGQAMAAEAGSDPRALSRFMATLEGYEKLHGGQPRRHGFFDSHPTTPERVAEAALRAEALAWTPGPAAAPDRAAFLGRLEGLLLGPNPAEGLFEEERFLHPDLGFTTVFPKGWQTVNARAGVGAFAPDGSAQVVLEIESEGSDPRAAAGAALEKLGAESGVRVVGVDDLSIASQPALRARLEVSARPGGRSLPVEITWVAKSGLVYRFTALAEPDAFQRHRPGLRAVSEGFRPLRADERSRIRETRLRLVSARSGESLEELSARSGNVWSPEETELANGLAPGARPASGQLLKVAVSQAYVPEVPR